MRDHNLNTDGAPTETILVEVAYATPEKQRIVSLKVPLGTTLFEAAELSAIQTDFPEIDLDVADMGIFGKLEKNPKARVLQAYDRVEIYRPLLVDPKTVRKKRALEAK